MISLVPLCLTISLLHVSHAAQTTELMIVTEQLPPYNYQDGTTIKGVAVEVTQALLKEVGLQADIHVLSWVRAYLKALDQPNVLIFSIVRTPDREELFHWIGRISTTKSCLFKLANRKDIQIKRLDDARPYLIGTWREDVREQYLLREGFINQKQLDSSGTPRQNIQKLMSRRIDLVADSELSFYFQLHRLHYHPNLVVKAFEMEDISLPFYIAFSKKTSLDLVETFRHGLERVKRKGIFQDIHQKYLGLASQVPGLDR
jgi:polar amino acid transport system substrate-binding protein